VEVEEAGVEEASGQPSGDGGADAAPARPDDAAGHADVAGPQPEAVTLQGEVLNGAECPVLKTPVGALYNLVSAEYGFTPGDYVEIEGQTVDLSFCAEGQTVRVMSMTAVPAPQGG
jgi:hypothetical protein